MAQTGYTPIQLYYSSTTTNVPLAADLANGELAINITDGKLFYKDNANSVQVIGWKVVPATAGGTGQTSYAVGDLLYANTTTTLAKLPDVATGNALISGGVGVAPSYGKIGLTTHVSGTLPVANGGTNLTSFTANGLVYASSTSALATGSAITFDGTNFATTGTASATKFIPTSSSVTGNGMYLPASNAVGISTNGTNAIYFTSGQNVLIGTTTGSGNNERFNVTGSVADFFYRTYNTNATPAGMTVIYSNAIPNNTGSEFIYCQDQTTLRFAVRSNGGIANYQANDVNLSDRREKINFSPAKSYLDVICSIPVQTYNYIDQNIDKDGGLTLGVVAQDVQAVAPELVTESNWGTEEEPKMRLSIYQTDLQYALMKSIQELSEQVTVLQARLKEANIP
jgi:hypothetical protein